MNAPVSKSLAQRIIDGLKQAIIAATCSHDWTQRKHPQQRWICCNKCGIRAYVPEPIEKV